MAALVTKPSLIEYNGLKFLIMDAPKDSNLHLYLKECQKYNVQCIARISQPTYSAEQVQAAGIQLIEVPFEDGASPPGDVINSWLDLVYRIFEPAAVKASQPAIAVHCVAGLGRAPVLVAIALIEFGMDAMAAVQLIRSQRRGTINAVQLNYLESYRKSGRKVGKGGSGGCAVM